jgi:shikimate kinase
MVKPIILIGFKHVGKTVLGAALAQKLNLNFIDLDSRIQETYHEETGLIKPCRKIVQERGMDYFRSLETKVLMDVMRENPDIISVGGGTPLSLQNQKILSKGIIVHVKARKGIVFERIMITGRPAFFPEGEEAYTAFCRTWEERQPVYETLANIEIDNAGSLTEGVAQLIVVLQEEVTA